MQILIQIFKLIVAVGSFPFAIVAGLNLAAWLLGHVSGPSYLLWMIGLLWVAFVPSALEGGAAKLHGLLQLQEQQSPIRWRGRYFLCKLGRDVLPVPFDTFKAFEASLLSDAEKREYKRLSELTHFSPSSQSSWLEGRRWTKNRKALVHYEHLLCLKIGRVLIDEPKRREAMEVFRDDALADGFKMAIEALEWLAEGEFEIDVMETEVPIGGVVLREPQYLRSMPLRSRAVVIPMVGLTTIKFLRGRFLFQYHDYSIHLLTDTGAWQFFDHRQVTREGS